MARWQLGGERWGLGEEFAKMVAVEDVPPKPVGRADLAAMSRGIRDEVALTGAVSLGAGAVVAAGTCASVMAGASSSMGLVVAASSVAAEGETAG